MNGGQQNSNRVGRNNRVALSERQVVVRAHLEVCGGLRIAGFQARDPSDRRVIRDRLICPLHVHYAEIDVDWIFVSKMTNDRVNEVQQPVLVDDVEYVEQPEWV